MKHLFLLILLCPALIFAQSDSLNQVDSKGKKQGVWTKKYENGKTRYIGEFNDDKPVGVFKYYDNYGVLTGEITHLTKDTASVVFYHDGVKVMSKGKYYKQQRTGNWKFFDLDGDITSQSIFLNGKKQGPSRIYYKDGSIAREENYKNDVLHGLMVERFKNGKLKFKGNYVDGNLDGKVEYFHGNGGKRIVGYYQYAVREKMWTYYDYYGKVLYMEFYKQGFLKWRKTPEELKADREKKKLEQDSLNLNPQIEK